MIGSANVFKFALFASLWLTSKLVIAQYTLLLKSYCALNILISAL
jgi:hypothetical protein